MTWFKTLFSRKPAGPVTFAPHEPAELFAHELNPAPAGIQAFYMRARDGKRIRYARTRTSVSPCRGTVVIFTGRNECIEKYHETTVNFLAAGLDVVSFDWRGQGDSEHMLRNRQKGHVRRFSDYLIDVEAVFEQVALPDCRAPFFVVAHSLGSLIALAAAPRLKSSVERMVLCAPFLGIVRSGWKQPFSTFGAGLIARVLSRLGLGSLFFGSGRRRSVPFAANRVTSSPERYARNAALVDTHPQLGLGGPTARWVAECVRTMDALNRRAESRDFRIPALILIAGADRIVPRDAVEQTVRLLPAAHALLFEKAEHELLQERDEIRAQVLAAILAFVPGSGPAGLRTQPETADAP